MRLLLLIIILFWSSVVFGQNCKCEKDSLLAEIISCDTFRFDNKALLYWNFNCDSSWLTFESASGKKEIIFSLSDGLQDMTGRLGHIYRQEYKNTFLIQNNVISGCCSPPEYYLHDKETGELKVSLGRLVFFSEDNRNPITIAVTNSNYDTTSLEEYNSLTIYNTDQDEKYYLLLPKGQIKKAMDATEINYPEYLFEEPVVNGETIVLTYHLKTPKDNSDKGGKTIKLDLRKYSK